jgi:serine/threonine-protein kinase RsbW
MRTCYSDTFQSTVADDVERRDDWHLSCCSSVEGMGIVIETVLSAMEGLGYPERDVFGTRLALEEAICNSIKHAHQFDSTKIVKVRYRILPNQFLVEVEDEGPGFDPSQVPDPTAPANLDRPSGRGLLLMHYYASWVRYNRRGNCVRFCICPSEPISSDSQPICPIDS